MSTGINQAPTGYLSPEYCSSLAEFGTPRELPRSGGWILERSISGFPFRDAMGVYPLFLCRDWSQLRADLDDLDDLGDGLVGLGVVADPFGDYEPEYLRECFPDVVVPYRRRFVIDLSRPPEETVSRHHRKNARRALRKVIVEECRHPERFLEEWVGLHHHLVTRHRITGIRAFSRASFAGQLRAPGAVLLRALHGDVAVGAQLWMVHGDVAYGHVLAFSDEGYRLSAGYALYWSAIEFFRDKVSWCDIGGDAVGLDSDGGHGLEWFKRGWASETRPAYFCGRIFNRKQYQHIVAAREIPPTDYFPAYRVGEM